MRYYIPAIPDIKKIPASDGRESLGFHGSVAGGMISRMKSLSHGVDMISCERLGEAVERHGERFLKRVFTHAELHYCKGKRRELEHLAGRFAAKEAVLKVLGTGWGAGIAWTDVETLNLPSGRPQIHLTGRCRQIAEQLGIGEILVSISHIETHAIASAVAIVNGGGQRE